MTRSFSLSYGTLALADHFLVWLWRRVHGATNRIIASLDNFLLAQFVRTDFSVPVISANLSQSDCPNHW